MNILIIGSGGREHALAWKAAQSPKVGHVFVAPGNAGTASEPKTSNVNINSNDIFALVKFAKDHAIDLTIVGPEAPLVAGIVDIFEDEKLLCFGPSKASAQLEASKYFCKKFMTRYHIPTAKFDSFIDIEKAVAYIQSLKSTPIVLKADGLAAGKGVAIAKSKSEAITIAEDMLIGNVFGSAGQRIIIEEFLEGEEVSFIAIVDGKHILPLVSSQDHKARDNGDQGPNTGGMGAYSPAYCLTSELQTRILQEIMEPTVLGMAKEGHRYIGFLYAGLMITKDGEPKVLEFNCRLGDPETQPIAMRLKSDLIELCLAALEQRLDQITVEWDNRPALGVVLAAGGYPNQYRKGDIIHGLTPETVNPDWKIFHAGTAIKDEHIVTSGGRVLCVTALGNDIKQAQIRAYKLAAPIGWENIYYRTDIGYRAIEREQ
jgi:phosphoribosylamine--glycine ligase